MNIQEIIRSLETDGGTKEVRRSWLENNGTQFAINTRALEIPLHQGFHSEDFDQNLRVLTNQEDYAIVLVETRVWRTGICGGSSNRAEASYLIRKDRRPEMIQKTCY